MKPDFSEFHKTEREKLHRMLYLLHSDIYWHGLERIKQSLLTLHAIEANSLDTRSIAREYISEFEGLRGQLETVGQVAANLRSRLIRENGCDGSCELKATSRND